MAPSDEVILATATLLFPVLSVFHALCMKNGKNVRFFLFMLQKVYVTGIETDVRVYGQVPPNCADTLKDLQS